MHVDCKCKFLLLSCGDARDDGGHDAQHDVEQRRREGKEHDIVDNVKVRHKKYLKRKLRNVLREDGKSDVVQMKPLNLHA